MADFTKLNGYTVKDPNALHTYDTVADLKADTKLKAGNHAQTKGYTTAGDNGHATYIIVDDNTLVEDGGSILDLANGLKAVAIIDGYVTPEMFGAKGDGETDDTQAWQEAVNLGIDVKALSKTYLVGSIEVTKNITIDCSNASFICDEDTLFNIHGSVDKTIENETDYVANDVNYAITDVENLEYTGFAFLRGTNNFQESREYYHGGFATTFSAGKINSSYPIPVVDTEIDLITPIKATLKNIKNIEHQTTSQNTHSIKVTYGFGCTIENITIEDAKSYIDIYIDKSLNVNLNNLNILHNVNLEDDVSYIVYIGDSAFCNLSNSYLFNKNWHCYTTSGNYLCYKNTVTNCELLSDSGVGIQDHENALGTTIKNCTASCIGVSGMGVIKDCIVETRNHSSQKRCLITLSPTSIKENSYYDIEDIYFKADSDTASPYIGIWFSNSPYVSGKTYYFTNTSIRNVKCNGVACTRCTTNDTTGTYHLGKVVIDNCQLEISLKRNGENYFDITDNEVIVSNINYYLGDRQSDFGMANNDQWNKVILKDSKFRQVRGVATDVTLINIDTTSYISSLSVSGKLNGVNILNRINPSVILGASDVNITSMLNSTNDKWFNINSKSGVKYYQHIEDGAFVTATITVE